MSTLITHKAIVKAVYPDHVRVSINPSEGECQGCAIASVCGKGQDLDVPVAAGSDLRVGDRVEVGAPIGLQRRATVLLLLVPLVLLIAVVAIGAACGAQTMAASAIAIGAVALWYLALYLSRLRLRPQATFRIVRGPDRLRG